MAQKPSVEITLLVLGTTAVVAVVAEELVVVVGVDSP
jgi:hypothetical protein